jgi:NAD(P)H-dependent FMN reductase
MLISIIVASIRAERKSNRVALYLQQFIQSQSLATAQTLDLQVLDFPLFHERLKFQHEPLPSALHFSEQIKKSEGIIIVTPEYNGGYPASLKNVVDLLTDEWKRKPVAICTVSSGAFGGSQVITSLQFSLWKIGAWTVPAMFPVPTIEKSFDEQGIPSDPAATDKRALLFVKELLWCIKAKQKMENEL